MRRNVTSPFTGARLHSAMLISNQNLRKAIEEWVEFGWPAPRPLDQVRSYIAARRLASQTPSYCRSAARLTA